MKKVCQLLFFLGLTLTAVQTAMAAGVSVKPDKLNFVIRAGEEQIKSVVVENISDRPVIYNLYVDELEDQIYLAPANFRLEVGEKRQVKVQASPVTQGLFATNLSIVTQDLDRRTFNVATGVKIPLTLQVAPPVPLTLREIVGKVSFLLMPLLTLAIIVLAVLLRKKKPWWQSLINIFKRK